MPGENAHAEKFQVERPYGRDPNLQAKSARIEVLGLFACLTLPGA